VSSHRVERVASVVRMVVSDAIANRLSDPRISHMSSVTRVEVSGDLRYATVLVSVMGSDTEGRRTLAGLQHARGYVQSLLAKRLTLRQCPLLRFQLDESIKRGSETVRLIEQTMAHDRPEATPAGEATAGEPAREPERNSGAGA